MAQDSAPTDVFALLDDEYARAILRATNTSTMSAPQLAEEIDASRPTVYRRIEQLQEANLLSASTELDAEGHHHNVYKAHLERIVIELQGDEFSVTMTRSEHPADRFTNMWEGI